MYKNYKLRLNKIFLAERRVLFFKIIFNDSLHIPQDQLFYVIAKKLIGLRMQRESHRL